MKKYFQLIALIFAFVFSKAEAQGSIYVQRPLINGGDLKQWAQEQGLKILNEDVLHVTLAYSRGGEENWPEAVEARFGDVFNTDPDHKRELDLFGKEKSTLVLKLNAPDLGARWEEFIQAGAKWDWPLFEPHITLSYEAENIDIEEIVPYYGDLIFGPEVWVSF